MSEFVQVVSECSIQKTKGMIISTQLTASDSMPVELDSGSIDIVEDFTYVPRKQHHMRWQSTE